MTGNKDYVIIEEEEHNKQFSIVAAMYYIAFLLNVIIKFTQEKIEMCYS